MPLKRAKLFDREAERYDRCRPGYPGDLIDEVLGPSPRGLSVLDVACGTGLAARPMAARGALVLGVELNPGMARIAERHGITTEVAAFEAWDPAGRAFDRVTCAQAWHWLDPAVRAAKAASVLRPGGRICLFWSMGSYPDDLADALDAAYRRALSPDSPTLVRGYGTNRTVIDPAARFVDVLDALRDGDGFSQLRLESFPWSRDYTGDQWVDELQSHSDHAALEPGVRRALLGEVGATIDGLGGAFRMEYTSILISAVRV